MKWSECKVIMYQVTLKLKADSKLSVGLRQNNSIIFPINCSHRGEGVEKVVGESEFWLRIRIYRQKI